MLPCATLSSTNAELNSAHDNLIASIILKTKDSGSTDYAGTFGYHSRSERKYFMKNLDKAFDSKTCMTKKFGSNMVVWKGAPTTPLIITKLIAEVFERNNLPGAIFTDDADITLVVRSIFFAAVGTVG
ncbi:hypothetical protein KIW84_065347 [Lathyrus oleraceus]|uniref:Uncharacterized protein n=1 Tax=Pisum sativum TaxID=3888 RepID=A0A9D5A9L9_PEA|nr:hypothetical protein KIW84_065347 [Pisum sativum]